MLGAAIEHATSPPSRDREPLKSQEINRTDIVRDRKLIEVMWIRKFCDVKVRKRNFLSIITVYYYKSNYIFLLSK